MTHEQFEQARRTRDKRLRRSMLDLLHAARGGEHATSGATLHELAGYGRPAADGPEDEPHTLRLLRDLVVGGYAIEKDTRTHKHQRFSMSHMEYEITAKGVQLIEEAIDVDPLIADQRIA